MTKSISEHDKAVQVRKATIKLRKEQPIGGPIYGTLTELLSLEDSSLAIMYDALVASFPSLEA